MAASPQRILFGFEVVTEVEKSQKAAPVLARLHQGLQRVGKSALSLELISSPSRAFESSDPSEDCDEDEFSDDAEDCQSPNAIPIPLK